MATTPDTDRGSRTTRGRAGTTRPRATAERLVDAAVGLLAERGPSAIQARAVADAAQVSTAAVYYHLGGLPELVAAVIDRGFRDLGDALTAVPVGDDPVTDLYSMALAMHEFGRSNPHLYDLMFGLSTRGSYRQLRRPERRSARSPASFSAVYDHLVRACGRLVTAGRIDADADPRAVADELWACVHGFVTLELGGYLDRTDEPTAVLRSMTMHVLVGLGDTAERAALSYAAARMVRSLPAAPPVARRRQS